MIGQPALAIALAALLVPGLAQAQAYQCEVPTSLPAARPIAAPALGPGPSRRTPTTAYTLALSWSPEFCRTRGSNAAHKLQCSGRSGRFGFIVHGLWPEGARDAPQWCRKVAPPPASVVRGQVCRTPSVDLISREWAKHGSCMARDPVGYYRVSNILFDAMRYPAMEQLSRDPALTAGALRQALAAANPGRPANSFGLLVNERGWLREIRVCLDRRFRPARCAVRQYGPRDGAAVKIWRGL